MSIILFLSGLFLFIMGFSNFYKKDTANIYEDPSYKELQTHLTETQLAILIKYIKIFLKGFFFLVSICGALLMIYSFKLNG